MRYLGFLVLVYLPLTAWAQEAGEMKKNAYRQSLNLTREANEELSEDDFVSAEANYRRAMSKSGENAVAPYNLGNAYYADGSYGEAFGNFKAAGERAAEKDKKHRAFHNMGNVYMQQKDYKNAIEAYKEALRNVPDDEETRYNLALAKELLEKDQDQNQDNQDEDQDEQENQDDQEQDQNQDQNEGENEQNQDQQQDQQQDGDSEKEDNKEGDGSEKQEQDRKPNEEGQEQKQPRPNQLSPQQIQNLLQAMENEEKKVKEKIDAKKVKGAKVKTEKDW